MNTITIPTQLTQSQYDNALFAIDRENADHYLMFGNVGSENILENSLWVCQDIESLNNTNPNDQPSYEVVSVDVMGEDGIEKEIEAVTFSTKDSNSNLDLEDLSEGKISWN